MVSKGMRAPRCWMTFDAKVLPKRAELISTQAIGMHFEHAPTNRCKTNGLYARGLAMR